MNTILRNFISVLRRYRLAAILNIFGLSIAFAVFALIMMQVDYDNNFDRCHRDADRIFRVEMGTGGNWYGIFSRPMAEAFTKSSPHILAGGFNSMFSSSRQLSVEAGGEKHFYNERAMLVSPSYTDVFAYNMVEGTDKALDEPDKAIIPLSLARKFFGSESAMDKQIENEGYKAVIRGVYRDFPENSSIPNVIYTPIPENENAGAWGNSSYQFFIRLDDAANAAGIVDNFKRTFDDSTMGTDKFSWTKYDFRLTPLPDVHFTTDVLYDATPKSSRQTVFALTCIAFVILIIAGINFANFSMALTPKRIRSINTQKVLGGSTAVIRSALILEAIAIAAVACLISIGIIAIMPSTAIAGLIDGSISIAAHPGIIAGTAALAILTGLLAGAYPAWYITSFPPALTLKGNFGLSSAGRTFRSTLIGIQFIASFALIIGASFMYLQNRYMLNSPLGYDKDEIIIAVVNKNVYDRHEALMNSLKSFSGIRDVTFAENLLSSADQYMGWGRKYHDREISYQCLPVTTSFLDVMGIKVSEGRNFRPDDAGTTRGAYIFNERARQEFDLQLNDNIDGSEIIGFMPDVKFASFRTTVTPMAFFVWGTENWGRFPSYVYIKVEAGSDLRAAISHVRSAIGEIDPDRPFDVDFFNEKLNSTYKKEQKLGALISLFSLLAVIISIVGVFGLVIFDSEYRRKEISLRKVHGASTASILIMFNRVYLRIVVICFLLASPAAYYAVTLWLENFAYKTPLHWWIFPMSFAALGVITVLTVTFQSWKAARVNPVESIRNA